MGSGLAAPTTQVKCFQLGYVRLLFVVPLESLRGGHWKDTDDFKNSIYFNMFTHICIQTQSDAGMHVFCSDMKTYVCKYEYTMYYMYTGSVFLQMWVVTCHTQFYACTCACSNHHHHKDRPGMDPPDIGVVVLKDGRCSQQSLGQTQ